MGSSRLVGGGEYNKQKSRDVFSRTRLEWGVPLRQLCRVDLDNNHAPRVDPMVRRSKRAETK